MDWLPSNNKIIPFPFRLLLTTSFTNIIINQQHSTTVTHPFCVVSSFKSNLRFHHLSLSPPKMAPPQAAVQGGQAPQGRQQQQQQQGGFSLTGIIRIAVFWYFASKFFSPKKPTEPSALISNLFHKGQPLVQSLFPFYSAFTS